MVNNVIGMVNYVIAARPSLLNFVIADKVLSLDLSSGRIRAWRDSGLRQSDPAPADHGPFARFKSPSRIALSYRRT